MKFFMIKQAVSLSVCLALLGAGPAWSASQSTTKAEASGAKSQGVAKTSTKAKAKAKAKAKPRAKAKAPVKSKASVKPKASVPPQAVASSEASVAPKPEDNSLSVSVTSSTASVPVVMATAAAVAVPMVAVAEVVEPTGYEPMKPWPAVNPYLAYQQPMGPVVNPAESLLQVVGNVSDMLPSLSDFPSLSDLSGISGLSGLSSLPSLPSLPSLSGDRSILPSIKTVYPTGEKPLVVLNFKCPTELVGITPIPIKLLRGGLDSAFELLNDSDMLSFNLQQVCQ
jgi:hypothetical protein